MKIRARTNGDVIDVPEDAATILIDAGIYERVQDDEHSTTMEPLTTTNLPNLKKRGR